MVIIGFPGVGKSHVARQAVQLWELMGYTDLESSHFDKSNRDWFVTYCEVALDLSRQGYRVFVSSHAEVRQYLLNNATSEDFLLEVFPSPELKEIWLERLNYRYSRTALDKDRRSYEYMRSNYDEAVSSMMSDGVKHKIMLTEDDPLTDLQQVLQSYIDSVTDLPDSDIQAK